MTVTAFAPYFCVVSELGGPWRASYIEHADEEALVARGLTCDQLVPLLVNGPIILVPGLLREQGRELLARMGKQPS